MSDPSSDAPLISVALCVHNGERYLREQLDSILAQRNVDLEIVALDDTSNDTSTQLLREYAARDPRIRCFTNACNQGATRSFEYAMSLAHGTLIAPCDQDDVWEPDKLAKLLGAIGDADLAYCDSAYIDANGTFTDMRVSDDIAMLSGRDPRVFLFENSVSGHATLLRREVFEAARPFPPNAFHDWWLALCAAARGGIVYLPEPLVRFRRHATTVSTLGRDRKERRPPARHRLWLQCHHAIIAAHARSNLRGHAEAQALLKAFDTLLDAGRSGPLLRVLWQMRDALPGGPHRSRNALRWWLRFRRKRRRARGEPVIP
ncbi:MAG TPA: glycosyltransferase [Rhodanobacteraceae bacterium]